MRLLLLLLLCVLWQNQLFVPRGLQHQNEKRGETHAHSRRLVWADVQQNYTRAAARERVLISFVHFV